jgi:hypothetical protein
MARKIRILAIATNEWCAVGQFLSALIQVGFDVAVVCPSGSPIQYIRDLSACYKYKPWRSRSSIVSAMIEWSPDLLVCNDDVAVRALHDLHRQLGAEGDKPENTRLRRLIETSLGDYRSFTTSRSKSELMSVARALEIACPPTIVANSYIEIEEHLSRLPYPVLIKLDASWGGRGVRLAHNDRELLGATLELSFPHDWPRSLKQAMARCLPDRWRPRFPQKLSIQHYVRGRPANRAVVCWQGKVLAGVSIEAIETDSEFGPTTLARPIEHAEMARAAEKIVATLKLSGFLGFDFVLDGANQAWFLEMNPRVTPACHLRFKTRSSLPTALFLELTGEQPSIDVRQIPSDVVALFPNRVSKEAAPPYFDDVPEQESAFVNACRRSRFFREMNWKAQFNRMAPERFDAKGVANILREGSNDD